MSKEYYQMGWTLDENYEEDYFCGGYRTSLALD